MRSAAIRALTSLLIAGPLLALMVSAPARAESLRCEGRSVAEGDSRLALLHACGAPQLADTVCAPLTVAGASRPLPPSWSGTLLPCVPVEEWLYDRGPGALMATVRLRDGRILSIRYGRGPS